MEHESRPTSEIPAGAPSGECGKNAANRAGHATLVLDRLGRILSCGEPAEELLGVSRTRLMGGWISDFIAGLFPSGSSPSYCTRYLAHLSAGDRWRRFAAVDGHGRPFLVDASLAQMTSGRSVSEIFLLNLRRPE